MKQAPVVVASVDSMQRIWPRRLGLVLGGLVSALVFLELALRLGGAVLPGEYQTASFLETHPEFGRRNRPGQGWKRTSEYTSWIEINSKGLRGPEVEYGKPVGEHRVMVLGDSFTFAEQVNQNETFVQRLEDRLNETSGVSRYRVLNASSNGWTTANELVFLAREGIKYQPDLVVLALYVGNDVVDNYSRVVGVREAERADFAVRGADALEGPRRLLRRSVLYTVFESGVLTKLPWWRSGRPDSAVRDPPRSPEEAQAAWSITNRLLQRTAQVSESQGAKFAIMMIPSARTVAAGPRARDLGEDEEASDNETLPGFEDPHATLSEIGNSQGFAMLDLLPAFRSQAARSRGRLFFRVNAHFTPAGHALAAQRLYEFLIERGLVAVK